MEPIQFIQVNLNHTKLAQDNIAREIARFNKNSTNFIIGTQEPYVHGGKHARKPLSCTVYTSKSTPRTAIYTSNALNCWYIEALSNADCTVIQTKINNRQTVIASIYLDIKDDTVTPQWLHKLLEYTQTRGTALLLCIDTNCHSSSFGPETNKRGEKLDEFIATYHLNIENVGSEYTFETSNAHTVIDITLSSRLSVSVTDWKVDKTNNFSDHNNITFTLCSELIALEKN